MKNVLFIGGPKDGFWETLPIPLPTHYKLIELKGILPDGPVEREVFYRLEYLSSEVEQYSVYLWDDLPTIHLLPALLRGYKQGEE